MTQALQKNKVCGLAVLAIAMALFILIVNPIQALAFDVQYVSDPETTALNSVSNSDNLVYTIRNLSSCKKEIKESNNLVVLGENGKAPAQFYSSDSNAWTAHTVYAIKTGCKTASIKMLFKNAGALLKTGKLVDCVRRA